MKSIKLFGVSLAIAMSCILFSCSQEDKEITTMYDKENIDISEAQSDFIKDMNDIGKKYQCTNSRAITQEDVANFSRWILNAGVDGLGGVAGGPYLGWLTGAAASTLYDKYLDNTLAQTRSVQQYIDVTTNTEYNNLFKEIAFTFCNNTSKNKLDSIGYIHNEILNKFMIESNNREYIQNKKIDFEQFFTDYKQIIEKLGYSTKDIDKAFNQNTILFLENMINAFAKAQMNPENYHEALNSISYLQADNTDTIFLGQLMESIIQSFPNDIPSEQLSSYCKDLNNAINNSKLKEQDIIMCKSLLQTLSCSYLYWSFSQK